MESGAEQVQTAPPQGVPWRVVGLALALTLLAWAFRNAEVTAALHRAIGLWPYLPLLLLPSALGTLLDVAGWRLLLAPFGQRPRWIDLVRVRLSADALLLGLPFGTLVSEGATPALLGRLCAVPLPEALAALATRRCLHALGHALYLGLGAVLGVLALRSSGEAEGVLQWAFLAVALALLGCALGAAAVLRRGTAGQRAWALLRRMPVPRCRAWLDRHAAALRATDERLARVLGARRSLALPLLVFLASWLAEALEAVIILGLLGSGLAWLEIFPVESGLSVVRAAAVFAPAGLGAQDLGYAQVLARLNVAEPFTTAASFAFLRRGKEVIWIGLGLWATPGRVPASPPRPAPLRSPDSA